MNRLPHFIIIGAMKAGTTSLYHYLQRHPEIAMSKVKETDFFLEGNVHQGLKWYRRQFPKDDRIKGEASPNYTKYPAQKGVAERIHQILPGVKLIYVLRDPVSRIVSHAHHNLLKTDLTREDLFEKLKNPRAHLINCSRYYLQLEQYLQWFSPEQILIATTEELNADRKSTLKKIFQFIGVEQTDFYDPQYDRSRHTSFGRRKICNALIRKKLRNTPYYNFVASRLHWLIPSQKVDKPQLPGDLEKHLEQVLRDDVHKLREFTGRDFQEWKYNYR